LQNQIVNTSALHKKNEGATATHIPDLKMAPQTFYRRAILLFSTKNACQSDFQGGQLDVIIAKFLKPVTS
jgi:hypothetical protein